MQAFLIVLPIFILIGLGWGLRRKGLFSPQTLKEINFFLYWFAVPATLLQGILAADINVLGKPLFVIATWLPYVVTIVVVWLIGRPGETQSRFAALTLSSTRGNHFFAGIPIIGLAMGEAGVAAGTVILAVSLVVMQLISLGSGQLALFGKVSGAALKATVLQLLKNPLFLSCLVGITMLVTGLNRLPVWVSESLKIVAGTCTGLALLGLGAGLHLENVFKLIQSVWKLLVFKLIVHPIVTWTILSFFGLAEPFVQAGTLLAAMPVAVNTAVISEEMGMDGEYCARGVAISTLVSLVSLPVWINVLGLV